MIANVGIIGRARVGKDTAGAWLVENRGYVRVGFADALKEAALRLNPLVPFDDPIEPSGTAYMRLAHMVHIVGWERAKENPEVRRTLQEYGMSIRDIDPEFWLRTALAKVAEINAAGSPVVITDVRFPNEADSLKRAGFDLVYIERADVPQLTHASEGALSWEDADLILKNDGSRSDFLATVEHMANLLTVPQRVALGIDQ